MMVVYYKLDLFKVLAYGKEKIIAYIRRMAVHTAVEVFTPPGIENT